MDKMTQPQKPPCAYGAAQSYNGPRCADYPQHSDSALQPAIRRKRTVLTNHGKRVLALLALLTLAAGFYAVYGETIQEMLRR